MRVQPQQSRWQSRIQRMTSSWVFHLLLSGVVLLLVFFRTPNFFGGDLDTARNYLNTIVSSLSTILALCISIILVAIQMTASSYSHRVLDFFVRFPYNASLFTLYLVTIMHSFFLMAEIGEDLSHNPPGTVLPGSLAREMSADLVLVVICFVSLLIYMYAAVQLLKPERIIELVLRDYQRAIRRDRWRSALDNVEQICDIAKRAASVSDSVTGTRCVEIMTTIASQLPVPSDGADPLFKVHQSIVDQWGEIVGVAIKERETSLLYGVLEALHVQGQVYLSAKAWETADLVIESYRQLAFSHLLAEGQVYYIERVAEHLYQLGLFALNHGEEHREEGEAYCLRTWQVVRLIGETAFTAQSASMSTTLEGLLMPPEVPKALGAMKQLREQKSAVVQYFELWKAFAGSASTREAARWATWWRDQAMPETLQAFGKTLAVALSLHIGRREIGQTLCYMWDVSMDELASSPLRSEDDGIRIRLFDGWPWRSIIET